MIFDFRFRPPYEEFLNLGIFEPPCFTLPPFSYHAVETPSARKQDMSLFFSEMTEAGICGGVLVPRALPGESVSNECVKKFCEEYPGHGIVAFGGINVSLGIAAAVDELEKCISYGFKGIAMEPGDFIPSMKADDARLYPVYERCERMGLPVVVTLSLWQGTDLSYSAPDSLMHVAEDFPGLQIVAAHACYPWIGQAVAAVVKYPNIWLIPDMYLYNPHTPGREMFIQAIQWLNGENILFGTAYPCYDMRQAVEDFMKLDLTQEQREKIFYKNAYKILSLE